MNSLTDLVEKLRGVEADRLVDVLRRMHNEGSRPDWGRLSESLGPAAPPAALAPDTSRTERGGAGASPSSGTGDDAREFFVGLEQKLRKQQSTADAVIGRLRARERRAEPRKAQTAPAQQLVSIVALVGTRAAGRFVVMNPATSPTRIELRVGQLTAHDGRTIPCAVTLEPSVFDLAGRGRRIVKVTFDLAGLELADREQLGAAIEAFGAGGRCMLKACVEIDVHREDGDAV